MQAWIINHMSGKVLDEITNPFPNFDGETIEVLGMDKQFHRLWLSSYWPESRQSPAQLLW